MNIDYKKKITNRMSYLIGHLIANKEMINDNKYCIDIIRQNDAVISALKKVNEIILRSHLDTCATTAIKSNDEEERKKVLNEILEIYKKN
jgi:DNA-binding FrmR family transcriptional regulator